MGNRFVVTGAAGFIGLHLCDALLKIPGSQVIGIDNERSGDWSRVSSNVEQVKMDIADMTIDSWRTILRPADVIFHLAAEKYNSSRSTPEKVLSCNVIGTERLIRTAAEVGVSRLVFTSSLYAYGSMGPRLMSETDVLKPRTIYGASKSIGEDLLRTYSATHGLSYNVARLFFIYGPNQYAHGGYKSVVQTNFERLLAGDSPLILGDGEQSLDYVYIDDCIVALILMARSQISGGTVNVASGHGVTINALTRAMLDIAGSKSPPRFGLADWTAGSTRVGSPDLNSKVFGWNSVTTLETGLTKVWQWMSSQTQ